MIVAKPALLTVDDDAEVLRAVERDLRRRYGERYRVLRADSGHAALEALRGLKRRNDSVALLLVDQRMPHDRGGVSRPGDSPLPRRQTGAADGLRGYRCS